LAPNHYPTKSNENRYWISLDFLVRIDRYQWVTRDKPCEKFSWRWGVERAGGTLSKPWGAQDCSWGKSNPISDFTQSIVRAVFRDAAKSNKHLNRARILSGAPNRPPLQNKDGHQAMLRLNGFHVRASGTRTADGIHRRFRSMRPQQFPYQRYGWPVQRIPANREPDARTKSTGLFVGGQHHGTQTLRPAIFPTSTGGGEGSPLNIWFGTESGPPRTWPR
jgi:hypothetical protein